MPRIPVNLITGFLGVGKTTLVIELLKRKPANERWAILVNEYGEVGIDGAMIDGERADGVTVREVAGGCVCCTTAPYMPVALAMLLQDGRPDRLIVETSGLGHPAKLIDLFRGQHYKDNFELRATIGLVAPSDFRCPGMFENPVFMDQVNMADVLVLTKTDRVPSDTKDQLLSDFQTWGESLFPPRLLIAAASHGVIDLDWLNLTASDEHVAKIADHHDHKDASQMKIIGVPDDKRLKFLRYESAKKACGWIFPPEIAFKESSLKAIFAKPELTRAKGVFRVEHDWISLNKSHDDVTLKHTAYRRDSRCEFFASCDWTQIEHELLASMIGTSDVG